MTKIVQEHNYKLSQYIHHDDMEANDYDQIKTVRNILHYVSKVINTLRHEQSICENLGEYTTDMLATKIYVEIASLYNNQNKYNQKEISDILSCIASYAIILLENQSKTDWSNTNYIGAKYISIINKEYKSIKSKLTGTFKAEEQLNISNVMSLMLMTAIRLKNIVNTNKINIEKQEVEEIIMKNILDIMTLGYILFDKISAQQDNDQILDL